jgi:hypothetical protein
MGIRYGVHRSSASIAGVTYFSIVSPYPLAQRRRNHHIPPDVQQLSFVVQPHHQGRDSNVIRPEFLWKYVTRGAMAVCKDNQEGIDIIVPVVFLDGNFSRQTVTAIMIKSRTRKITVSMSRTSFLMPWIRAG